MDVLRVDRAPVAGERRARGATSTVVCAAPDDEPNGAAAEGKYAAGARAKKFFYCATDPGLKRVKSKLIWADDPAVFTNKGLRLHAPCQ